MSAMLMQIVQLVCEVTALGVAPSMLVADPVDIRRIRHRAEGKQRLIRVLAAHG